MLFVFELQENKKINFVENLFYLRMPVFPKLLLVFPGYYETYLDNFDF